MDNITLNLPLSKEKLISLKAGDECLLNGVIYCARDAAHKLITESLDKCEPLPFVLDNAAVYYCGATPTLEGEIIGSCGPTTSSRMDDYTPHLIENGLKVMIGKGKRNEKVVDAMKKHGAIYFAAVGGAGALIKNCVTKCELVAYEHLGCEAVTRLNVKNLPLIVAIDAKGNSVLK